MLNEAIATPGSIQQATINISGALKKAVNLTPFSFDPTFNGQADEFTTADRKTIDYTGLPAQPNANDIVFGGLGSDWLHGGRATTRSRAPRRSAAPTDPPDGPRWTTASATSSASRAATSTGPTTRAMRCASTRSNADGRHVDRTRRAGEFALYDEYDPLRRILLDPRTFGRDKSGAGVEFFLNFRNDEGVLVPAGDVPNRAATASIPTPRPTAMAATGSSATPATTGWSAEAAATTSTAASATTC